METRKLDLLRIYDWHKTEIMNKISKIDFERIVPQHFSKEIKNEHLNVQINGNWKIWRLTDEGEGQYPILKCIIESGFLKIRDKCGCKKYSLENSWIKICFKIKYDNINGEDTYSIDEKNLKLYSINNSFNSKYKKPILEGLLDNLLVACIKENIQSLNKFFKLYKVKTEIKEDLSLLGWDTGFSTSFTHMNKTIENEKKYPENFEYNYNQIMSMSGDFGPWGLTTGADGQNVNFICKIQDGNFNIMGNENTFTKNDSVHIQLKLKYINIEEPTFEDPTSLNDGNQADLIVKTDEDENNNPPVTVLKVVLNNNVDPMDKVMLESMFKIWFNDNIEAFKQIFSSCLLEDTSKNPGFQWLKPTKAYYGVASVETENGKPDLDSSVFSVMSMVENNKNSKPSHAVDSRILDAVDNESAFGITTPLYVKKWLIAGLEMMQIGTIEDFDLINNGMGFINNKKLLFGTFENADGQDVPSYVEKGNLRIEIVNNQLKIELIDIYWKQSKRLNGHLDYTQYFNLELQSGVDELGEKYENVLIPVPVEPEEPKEGEEDDPTEGCKLIINISQDEFNIWDDVIGDILFGIAAGVLLGAIGKAVGKGLGKVLKPLFKRSASGRYVLVSTKGLFSSLKKTFSTDSRIISEVAREEIELIELNGAGTAATIVANTPTNIGTKIWANRFKFIGGLIAQSVLFAVGSEMPKLVKNIIDAYDKKHYSVMPTINSFVLSTVGSVMWPDTSEFKLESAELRGLFLLGGKLENN